jgi:hypothetical protein
VAEANAEDSRFPSESAFCPLHRFGDLRDWCSGLRMGFEFLNVFLPSTTDCDALSSSWSARIISLIHLSGGARGSAVTSPAQKGVIRESDLPGQR